jgi:polyphosphate kinase
MTLYRVAHESKIIEALISAAENGKEVVAIVELRARFDEQNNIDFSKQLEEAGCTVIYGFEAYKVHSKLTLITKKKGEHLEYISQIGTGNYNEKTSEQYTDLSLVTADPEIGAQLAKVFHNLAMERLTEEAGDLLVAPLCFKSVMLQEMDAEIAAKRAGKQARIVIKCNSISDRDIIEKISEASCAGVPVQMIVRGICCLKAGVPGLTENVTVRSIVGRYLEHERIYAFGDAEHPRVYIASADFLTRNTERRVEVGVRVRDHKLVQALLALLDLQLRDNVNARQMQPDGTYTKVKPAAGELRVDCQQDMYAALEHAWPTASAAAHGTRMKHTTPQKQTETSAAQPAKACIAPRKQRSHRLINALKRWTKRR